MYFLRLGVKGLNSLGTVGARSDPWDPIAISTSNHPSAWRTALRPEACWRPCAWTRRCSPRWTRGWLWCRRSCTWRRSSRPRTARSSRAFPSWRSTPSWRCSATSSRLPSCPGRCAWCGWRWCRGFPAGEPGRDVGARYWPRNSSHALSLESHPTDTLHATQTHTLKHPSWPNPP